MPLMVMSFGALALGFSTIIGSYLMTLGKTRAVLGVNVASLIAYFPILLIFIPSMNLIGAAISKAILGFLMLIFSTLAIKRYLQVKFDKEGIYKSLTSSFLALIIVIVSNYLNSSLTLFPIYLLLYLAVYISALALLNSIHDYDVKLIEEFLPRRARFIASFMRKFIS